MFFAILFALLMSYWLVILIVGRQTPNTSGSSITSPVIIGFVQWGAVMILGWGLFHSVFTS